MLAPWPAEQNQLRAADVRSATMRSVAAAFAEEDQYDFVELAVEDLLGESFNVTPAALQPEPVCPGEQHHAMLGGNAGDRYGAAMTGTVPEVPLRVVAPAVEQAVDGVHHRMLAELPPSSYGNIKRVLGALREGHIQDGAAELYVQQALVQYPAIARDFHIFLVEARASRNAISSMPVANLGGNEYVEATGGYGSMAQAAPAASAHQHGGEVQATWVGPADERAPWHGATGGYNSMAQPAPAQQREVQHMWMPADKQTPWCGPTAGYGSMAQAAPAPQRGADGACFRDLNGQQAQPWAVNGAAHMRMAGGLGHVPPPAPELSAQDQETISRVKRLGELLHREQPLIMRSLQPQFLVIMQQHQLSMHQRLAAMFECLRAAHPDVCACAEARLAADSNPCVTG